jgi:hypothetical protein
VVPLRTAAYMAAELDAVLALLGGPTIPETAYVPPSPDVKFEEPTLPDLQDDPINSSLVGSDPSHQLRTTPVPLARETVAPVVGEAVFDVPEVRARPASELDAKQAVVGNVSQLSAPFQQHLSLARSANSDARRSGTLAASIAYTLGQEGTTNMEASPVAIATRICAASLAVRQGAIASAQPVEGDLDVVVVGIGDVGKAEDMYPDYYSVYIPTQLSDGLASCLLSLLVVGGPGAYRWRYRGGAAVHGKAGLMPSIARWMHGGGHNSLLAVFERSKVLPAVGGGALTLNNLLGLEAYYRRHFGHAVFDAAWRTIYAAAAVYLSPAVELNPVIKPGDNFVVRKTSTILGDADLQGPNFHWNWNPAVPDGYEDMIPNGFWDFNSHNTIANVGKLGWRLARFLDNGLPERNRSADMEDGGMTFVYMAPPAGGGDAIPHERFINWEELFENVHELGRSDRHLFKGAWAWYAHLRLRDMMDDDIDEGPGEDIPENWRFHNVFGARDHVIPHLPSIRMHEVVALVSHFVRPAVVPAVRPAMSVATSRARARNYVAHLHLANYYAYVKSDLWPADLVQGIYMHAPYVRKLPDALKPWFWMGVLDNSGYDGQNWWVLESPYMIRSTTNFTAFGGFAVPGGWLVDQRGVVAVASPTTNYAALEAAFRSGTSEGGTISASGRFGATRFDIIRGRNGMLNSLAFSPRIATTRGVEGVDLAADNGFNSLQVGANLSAGIIFST